MKKLSTTEILIGIAAIAFIGYALLKNRTQTVQLIGNTQTPGTESLPMDESAKEQRKIELVGLISNASAQLGGLIAYDGDKAVLEAQMNKYIVELNSL